MKKKEGFTLVELLAVIVILALLITISVPAVTRIINSSKKVGISDFAKKVFREAEIKYNADYDLFQKNFSNMSEKYGTIFNLSNMADGIETGDYEGKILIDYDGNMYLYIHDKNNMIINYAYDDNDSTLKEVVKKYSNTSEINNLFSDYYICSQHAELEMCYSWESPVGFFVNQLDIPAISTNTITNEYYDLVGEIKRYLKPGSNIKSTITGITHIKVKTVNSAPANSKSIGSSLSKKHVWLSKEGSTLYFCTDDERGIIGVVGDASYLFSFFTDLISIELYKFDFTLATSINSLFEGCTSIEEIDADSMNISHVNDLESTFKNCKSLKRLYVTNWDTSNIKSLYWVFHGCNSLETLDVSRWDVSKVETMDGTFSGCTSLVTLDLSNWNTKSLVTFYYVFKNMFALENLNVTNLNTSRVRTMAELFNGCRSLKSIDLSNWDTRNLENMVMMFGYCSSLEEIDLSNWDIKNVKSVKQLFAYCSKLKVAKVGKNYNTNTLYGFWDTNQNKPTQGEGSGNIIEKCDKLEYLDISHFDKFAFPNYQTFPSTMKVCYVKHGYGEEHPLTINGFTLTEV